jgi:hypothetical protein
VAALPSASNAAMLAERFGADNGRIARIILCRRPSAFVTFSRGRFAAGARPVAAGYTRRLPEGGGDALDDGRELAVRDPAAPAVVDQRRHRRGLPRLTLTTFPQDWRWYGAFLGAPFTVVACIALWRQLRAPSSRRVTSTLEAVAR